MEMGGEFVGRSRRVAYGGRGLIFTCLGSIFLTLSIQSCRENMLPFPPPFYFRDGARDHDELVELASREHTSICCQIDRSLVDLVTGL